MTLGERIEEALIRLGPSTPSQIDIELAGVEQEEIEEVLKDSRRFFEDDSGRWHLGSGQ